MLDTVAGVSERYKEATARLKPPARVVSCWWFGSKQKGRGRPGWRLNRTKPYTHTHTRTPGAGAWSVPELTENNEEQLKHTHKKKTNNYDWMISIFLIDHQWKRTRVHPHVHWKRMLMLFFFTCFGLIFYLLCYLSVAWDSSLFIKSNSGKSVFVNFIYSQHWFFSMIWLLLMYLYFILN